jgi:hypothetical protein
MSKPLLHTVPDNYFAIFTGIFLYNKIELHHKDFVPWLDRLKAPQELFAHLKKTYYENYLNVFFSESPIAENKLPIHSTRQQLLSAPYEFSISELPEHHFQIAWFDRYLFSDGIGIFAFKVRLSNEQNKPLHGLANLIRLLRNTECEITVNNESSIKIGQLIHEWILPGLTLAAGWDKHLSRLKHFTIVNDSEASSYSEYHSKIIFELAHAMPIGSVDANNAESPTGDYYDNVFRESVIEVYGNWKALALFDSFTRLSVQFPDTFHSWELEYFHIYVYCLSLKYQLYGFNDQWNSASQSKKKAAVLKDKFTAFQTEHSSPTIAYKFLPNLMFEKISASLEIQKEMETMEAKMTRITEVAESKTKEKKRETSLQGSVIVPGFQYDIFISYRSNDNKLGWVTEFAEQLKNELASTIKDPVSVYLNPSHADDEPEATEISNLNCLIFLPVASHTYCDSNSISWKNELLAFHKMASASAFGLNIKLGNGNVTSRILPVCIHELDEEDRDLFAEETGMELRAVDFIYREPGVNRPLKADDDPKQNLSKTSYRNQVNKIANAVKDVVKEMKKLSKQG